jgi:hypothetical protein
MLKVLTFLPSYAKLIKFCQLMLKFSPFVELYQSYQKLVEIQEFVISTQSTIARFSCLSKD